MNKTTQSHCALLCQFRSAVVGVCCWVDIVDSVQLGTILYTWSGLQDRWLSRASTLATAEQWHSHQCSSSNCNGKDKNPSTLLRLGCWLLRIPCKPGFTAVLCPFYLWHGLQHANWLTSQALTATQQKLAGMQWLMCRYYNSLHHGKASAALQNCAGVSHIAPTGSD